MEGLTITRRGKLFAVGSYPDKRFEFTADDLREAVRNFEPVPIEDTHLPSIFDGKLGEVRAVSAEDGRTLTGTVVLPRWLNELFADEPLKVSCNWCRLTKRLKSVALVPNPRISDAALFAAFSQATGESLFDDSSGGHFVTIGGHAVYIGEDGQIGGQAGKAGKKPKLIPATPREGFREEQEGDRKRLKIGSGPDSSFVKVHVNTDPKAPIQGIAYRADGTSRYYYSSEHQQAQHAAKFERQREFHEALPGITEKLYAAHAAGGKGAEEAGVLLLQKAMGFRVGGEGESTVKHPETGAEAKVPTFGASTLRKEHVKVEGDMAHFDFPGKDNVRQQHRTTDPHVVAMMKERLARPGETIFNTTADKVRNHLKTVSPNPDFIPHDFRTWNATAGARDIINNLEPPKTQAEYKRAVKAVGEAIGKRLGDEPGTVLKHYIDPAVFQDWEAHVEAHSRGTGKADFAAGDGAPADGTSGARGSGALRFGGVHRPAAGLHEADPEGCRSAGLLGWFRQPNKSERPACPAGLSLGVLDVDDAEFEALFSDVSQEERDRMDPEDFGEPPDGFPIRNQGDLDAAAHLIGKAGDPEKVKARIIKIAKRKGLRLPDAWKDAGFSLADLGRKGNNPMSAPKWWGKLGALLTGAGADPEKVKEIEAEFSAEEPDPKPDDRIKRLEAALQQERQARLLGEAATFARGEVQAKRALPAEEKGLEQMYMLAALDDAAHPQEVAFSTGGEVKTGSRVDALKATLAARPAHLLTADLLKQEAPEGSLVLFAKTETPAAGQEKAPDEKRVAELLGKSTLGRAVQQNGKGA